jgi:hypothetical protein
MTDEPNLIVPTITEMKLFWDAQKYPSSRGVARIMRDAGFTISDRTIARMAKNNFEPAKQRNDPMRGKPEEFKAAFKEAVQGLPPEIQEHLIGDLKQTGLEAAVAGKIDMPTYEIMERDRAALMEMSEPDLQAMLRKERIVMNILLARHAARTAHVLVITPKETAPMIEALTDAVGPTLAAALEMPRNGDNARLIEIEANPVADAIAAFRRKQVAA